MNLRSDSGQYAKDASHGFLSARLAIDELRCASGRSGHDEKKVLVNVFDSNNS